MASANADRNLLYGVLALQMGFIGRDALISALNAWVVAKDKPLSRILIERQAISEADHPPIEHVVRRHLEKQEDDPARSLTAVDFELTPEVRSLLLSVDDPDFQASLAHLHTEVAPRSGPDADATTVWGQGEAQADRQQVGQVASPRPVTVGARFRVLRPHAKGGLGEVHVAWDEELGRYVALKEIRPEYAHKPKLRVRFLREAEVNGNLEHPGIVPIYGLGTYPDGRPYYAMRFVQGETLQAALERWHAQPPPGHGSAWALKLRPLLRALLDVCYAVEYAHSRGVLHRDLKPSNVLLGKYGETLIIDWGVAKVIARPEEESARTGDEEPIVLLPHDSGSIPTVAGETLGSPPYMSPEQARGLNDEVGRASDVYSLGATLYAILTGQPPVTGSKTSEILAKVIRGDIAPVVAVKPRVPAALSAICREAMRRDPAERYPSAFALAEDLEHWMADQPVGVYADPLSTRLLRWSRHHKSLVAASLALLVTAVLGLSVATVVVNEQKGRVEQARVRAVVARWEAERSLAEAVAARRLARDHLKVGLDVVDQLVTIGDRQLIRQETTGDRNRFLETAMVFIRRFREREPGDRDVQAKTAQLARRLANLHRLTGKFDQADPFYDEAEAIFTRLVGEPNANPRHGDLLAETLIDRGGAWLIRGKVHEAEAAFVRARDLARKRAQASPEEPMYRRTLARSLNQLGSAHLMSGRDDAAGLFLEALAALEPLADAALPKARQEVIRGRVLPLSDQLEVVATRCNLAEARGSPDDEVHLRRARERTGQLVDQFQGLPSPDITRYHAAVGVRLARLLTEGEGVEEAARLLDDAIERLDALVRQNPDIPGSRIALADALAARARTRLQAVRLDEAGVDADAARSLLEALQWDFPRVPEHPNLLAEVFETLGQISLRRGPGGAGPARVFFEQAIRAEEDALGLAPGIPAFEKRLAAYRAAFEAVGRDAAP